MANYLPDWWLDQPTPRLEAQRDLVMAFYGLLMVSWRLPELEALGDFAGACLIPGLLYDVNGRFPALALPEPGVDCPDDVVRGRLWVPAEGCAEAALRIFDSVEGFRPDDIERSLYRRETVALVDPPGLRAEVYIWNDSVRELRFIPSGDWNQYRRLP